MTNKTSNSVIRSVLKDLEIDIVEFSAWTGPSTAKELGIRSSRILTLRRIGMVIPAGYHKKKTHLRLWQPGPNHHRCMELGK